MSASGDETRKGEAITDAAATQSVMPQADGSDSIALQGDSSPTQFSWSREAPTLLVRKRREEARKGAQACARPRTAGVKMGLKKFFSEGRFAGSKSK